MAFPPGGIGDGVDGDRKRLMQRADTFSIGTGSQRKKDLEELDEAEDAFESVLSKTKKSETENVDHSKELEEHRAEKAQLEAERRGSSSPSHQPLLGLSILPGITNPSLTVSTASEGQAQRRSEGVVGASEAHVESVSAEILQGLRTAGLPEPVVTLDDPRLAGSAQGMLEHFTFSLRGSERVYVWSKNSCHQVISVGLHGSSVESAVGTTVETLTRRGQVDEKQVSRREAPTEDFQL